MNKAQQIIGFALGMQAMMEVNQENWKGEIRAKWELTKKMPRKKKKRERKSLLLEWSIASWSPFDDLNF